MQWFITVFKFMVQGKSRESQVFIEGRTDQSLCVQNYSENEASSTWEAIIRDGIWPLKCSTLDGPDRIEGGKKKKIPHYYLV